MTPLNRHRSTRILTVCATSLLLLLAACATPPGTSTTTSVLNDAGAVGRSQPVSNSASTGTSTGVSTQSADEAARTAQVDLAATPGVEAAAPVPVPVDPLRPDEPLDLNDRSAQTDLWARVRRGFAIPDLDGDLVHEREQWYATRPDYVQRMTERGSRYLFHIVEELERRNMPTELALLPFIESAFNPQAISSAKASGMWQFMSSTGKDFALKQNVFRDDRRDVLASTRAALDYLARLHAMFGDWHLALAAYNWGEGSVQRAIARNQKLGLPTDYASLKMPVETQNYVPKLQAVKNIVARPGDFGLTLPALRNHPYFLSVPIERDMDVAVAIKLAGLPLDEFQTLNPQMNKPVILAAGTAQVLLPYDNANQFVNSLPLYHGPLATWTAWVAPKTLHPAEAARLVAMTEAQLRAVNHIPPHMLVRAGSTLLVRRDEARLTNVSSEIADNAVMALSPDTPPLRKTSFKAGRADNVASIAKRYRVSAATLAQWNSVSTTASFKPGQSVVVFVSGKATQQAKSAQAGGTKVARAHHGASARSIKRAAAAATPVRVARR